MASVIILADDLSGAAELAGLAFARGLSAEVQREIDLTAAADVIAVDCGSRQLAPAAAAERQRTLAAQLDPGSRQLLFKKVDSLLRGNVRAEIEALMQAAGYARTILVPANPSRGRTIVSGRYLVDGQPLDQSQLAQDPHHPRQTADVAALLGDGTQGLSLAAAGSRMPPRGIIVPDAATADDLARLAAQVDDETLAAGAADFFGQLLNIRTNPSSPLNPRPLASLILPPALLVCGSRVAWPVRMEMAQAARIPVHETAEGAGVVEYSPAYSLGIGEREMRPAAAMQILTTIAAGIVRQLRIQTILVEGGETAAALAEKLGWTRFRVVGEAPAGVGVLRPVAGEVAPLVLAKPGSYPWAADIWTAFADLVHG